MAASFSGPKEFHVNVPANQAPDGDGAGFLRRPRDRSSAHRPVHGHDANGDPLLYFLDDNSAAATSGHFTVNGVVQAANHDLRGVGSATRADHLHGRDRGLGRSVRERLDGVAFSGPKEFHVNVVDNRADGHGAEPDGASGQC